MLIFIVWTICVGLEQKQTWVTWKGMWKKGFCHALGSHEDIRV